jgi:aromatic ring-opening dioxygenase catalytic subunit (LigB family)
MTPEARMTRQPSIFMPHGGGPCFWIDAPPPFGKTAWEGLRLYLAGLVVRLPERPKAILLVTAHWEEDEATFSVNPAPGMIFDYYNFPPHTYELSYRAPGAPDVSRRAAELLGEAGISARLDSERGYDHGVFVPMLIVDPGQSIPVAMASLRHDLDPERHLAIGRALAPLRDEGVLVVGSGMSYHDLRHFRDGEGEDAAIFDAWLAEAATAPQPARDAALAHWAEAPRGRACHPREEHLLPLMVAAGAAGADVGVCDFRDIIGGKTISAYRFG